MAISSMCQWHVTWPWASTRWFINEKNCLVGKKDTDYRIAPLEGLQHPSKDTEQHHEEENNSYQARKHRCWRGQKSPFCQADQDQVLLPPVSTHSLHLPRTQKTLHVSQRLQPILDTNDQNFQKLLTVWTIRDLCQQVLHMFLAWWKNGFFF